MGKRGTPILSGLVWWRGLLLEQKGGAGNTLGSSNVSLAVKQTGFQILALYNFQI